MESYENWLKIILETILVFGVLMVVISATLNFIEYFKDNYFDN